MYQRETNDDVWDQFVMSNNMNRFIKGPFENKVTVEWFSCVRKPSFDEKEYKKMWKIQTRRVDSAGISGWMTRF